ncbi:metaxin-3-like [Schistocerca gregaria]|uniref:metaxin-3-like n=1 Tax=Schistocerca gregaria TaxID=7010 RepID=UPI00211E4191|nr:metaxin-3-like [Schistocerca gregaria]
MSEAAGDLHSNIVRLHQYGPNENVPNLPTFDPLCLAAQAYMKCASVPFVTVNTDNAETSPWKKLPFLCISSERCIEGTEIIKELSTAGYDLDKNSGISPSTSADILAWSNLLNRSLYPAQLFNWFGELSNYEHFMKPIICRAYSFPIHIYKAKTIRSSVLKMLAGLGVDEKTGYEEAKRIYAALSSRLADREYFFSDSPSSFDSVAFGYLATQLYASNLPVNNMYKMLAQHGNLVRFVNNMYTRFFQGEPFIVKEIDRAQLVEKELQNAKQESVDQVYPEMEELSARTIVALGIGIITLFLCTQNVQFSVLCQILNKKLSSDRDQQLIQRRNVDYLDKEETDSSTDDSEDEEYEEEQEEEQALPDLDSLVYESDSDAYIEDDGGDYDFDDKYLEHYNDNTFISDEEDQELDDDSD